MSKMSKVLSVILATSLLFVTGCSNKDQATNSDSEKPIVAVTIIPEQTFVEAVCGDKVQVVTLVPPGSSPETYEPTPAQMEDLSKASIFFSIGVPIEEASINQNIGDVKTVALAKEVSDAYPDRTFENGERDPHIWLSPKRAKVMVEAIAREMGTLDEANRDTYEKNAKDYIAKLDEVDKEITKALEGVQNRKFVVFHPAFGYLADDYGLEMFALEEEGKEATPKHLEDMIDLAKEQDIKAIFYQEEIDSSQSEAYAEEIGGKTIQLEPLSADYIENLKSMAETMAEVMK
jgi:zinc transport system substrate-binding protein